MQQQGIGNSIWKIHREVLSKSMI
jgi:hypothetical protein